MKAKSVRFFFFFTFDKICLEGGIVIVICYSKCSTCKKALDFLDKNNVSYELRDIKIDNPKKEELIKWSKENNIDIQKFFNTSGVIYRENNLSVKTKTMSFSEKVNLLSSDGMLVKRPILIKVLMKHIII